jgi:tetratricopeptide (TPR) repeat protein
LGQVCHYQSPEHFGKAYEYYQKSIKMMLESKDKIGKARVERDLGSLFSDPIAQDFFNIDSAIYYFNKAYQVISVYGDKYEIAGFELNLSWFLIEKGMFEEAKIKIENSSAYFHQINNEFGIFACLRAYGHLYENMKNYTEAESYYLKAIAIAEKFRT